MTPAEHGQALEEIDTLIGRDLDEAMARALNHGSGPDWAELAARFRRGAELADTLANANNQDQKGKWS